MTGSKAFYNEFEPFAAAWLRELIKAGVIADGEVSEADMWDVVPSELMGFRQVHLCAGIGGWSAALGLAGWPDDRSVWTVSLPCQPFSAAGKGAGLADERGQLADAFFWLAGICRPDVIFGEQVEAAIKHDWLDVMATQLESIGYSVGSIGFPACSTGAPHIRQRLYWVANDISRGCNTTKSLTGTGRGSFGNTITTHRQEISPARRVADAGGVGLSRDNGRRDGREFENVFSPGILGDSGEQGLAPIWREVRRGVCQEAQAANTVGSSSRPNFWSDCEWIPCRDGKARPTKPGLFPLAHGVRNRVGTLRGAGNAIVPQAAAAFIRAFMEHDQQQTKTSCNMEV